MVAARVGDHKLIRVNQLPSVMYNLKKNIGETNDLSEKKTETFNEINLKLENWENTLSNPIWTEGATWDTITWMIHQDLMSNQKVRLKSPGQLKKFCLSPR